MNEKRDNDGRGNFRRRRRGGRGGNGPQSGPTDADDRQDAPEKAPWPVNWSSWVPP